MKHTLHHLVSVWLICLSLLTATQAIGQEGANGDTIQDISTGSPLPGATVQVKGTTRGTTADASGQFRITAALCGLSTWCSTARRAATT